MRVIWGCILTAFAAAGFTFVVRALAHRLGMVSYPRLDRWHRKPTAMLGGVAIYISFAIGYLIFGSHLHPMHPILGAASLLFFAGLLDDVVQIKPYAKLIIQLVAAAIVVYFGVRLTWTRYEVVNDFITIFWLVGITNAINLLDNMDGLAGGISLISCVFLGLTFLINGQPGAAGLAALLGAAALGFLAFNFNPASIFMGDCGAMFLGFVLGSIALVSDYGRSRNLAAVLFTPALILAIPIFDTCVVTVTRKLSGRPISQGGRDHTSHRLVALGMSERRAVLLLYLLASISGTLALMVRLLNLEVALLLVPGFALAVVFLGLYLGKVRISDARQARTDDSIITEIPDFYYKRRVFEVLLDLILVILAYYGAYLLRWDGALPGEQLAIFIRTLPLVIVVHMSFLLIGGVYKGLWRYVGAEDLWVIARSVVAGGTACASIVMLIYWLHGPSRAVFLLDMLLLAVFIVASRFSFRFLRMLIERPETPNPDARPVFIYGADDGGDLLCRLILTNPDHRYAPVGFIDDDYRKTGKLIRGYRIFNSRELPGLIKEHGVRDVLVSSTTQANGKLDSLRSMGACLKMMSIRIEEERTDLRSAV
jgi:UDP-GlcNAc:undecaprenyl-phosphate/decaprenyl-phosphate GlcNAc-1-phosphate transferase